MSERSRGRWRYDAASDSFVEAASEAELEAEREARSAADARVLAEARDSYVRDRDAARRPIPRV